MQQLMNNKRIILSSLLMASAIFALSACSPSRPPPRSHGHIVPGETASLSSENIPGAIQRVPLLPKPEKKPKLETYTVVVTEAPAKELLFALARDAKLNLDVYDDIEGQITINAIDQTLPQILDRIAKQSNIRYEIDGKNLTVSADTPYLHTYAVEYVNLNRQTTGRIDLSTQISATGSGDVGEQGGGGSTAGGNNSNLTVQNKSDNQFWETLYSNIVSIISDPEKKNPNKQVSRNNVIMNRETGLITVRATSKQHVEIQKYIDSVVSNAQRQVLIEATIVEVTLSNDYQAGVDWSRVANNVSNGATLRQLLTGTNLANSPVFSLEYSNTDGDLSTTIRVLEEFGELKVLSSPKIMALNNQSAVLKVVDNRVYFTVDINVVNTINSLPIVTSETQIHTVPVGFVMGVTPYISSKDQVILNVRPTISRILRFVNDPNPELTRVGAENLIPEIQVREMESILRLNNGQMGIIGGLMQDAIDKNTDAVPLISRIPFIGNAFKYRNNQLKKSELVIFIRAIVVENPSLDADLYHLNTLLPSGHES